MAKKTPKQGKKVNKRDEQQAVVASQGSAVPGQKAAEKAEKKSAKSAKEQPKNTKTAKDQPKSGKSGKSALKKEGIFSKIVSYFKNVRLEIKRTTWPSRDEVLRMSLIVIGALLFFGIFIFVMDWVMTQLLDLYGNLTLSPDASGAGDIPATSDTPASSGSDTTEQ
jgi:preprotein translocase subunit SecE